MATPSTVISRGYGTWGSVNLLPTRGYGIGAAVVTTPRPLALPATLGPAALRATGPDSTLPAKQDGLSAGAN